MLGSCSFISRSAAFSRTHTKTVQHVCNKGRTDFKISMQREAQVIKDCLSFSGPPDPLRGEEIYRRCDVSKWKEIRDVALKGIPSVLLTFFA